MEDPFRARLFLKKPCAHLLVLINEICYEQRFPPNILSRKYKLIKNFIIVLYSENNYRCDTCNVHIA